jgi:hypothetical protein
MERITVTTTIGGDDFDFCRIGVFAEYQFFLARCLLNPSFISARGLTAPASLVLVMNGACLSSFMAAFFSVLESFWGDKFQGALAPVGD